MKVLFITNSLGFGGAEKMLTFVAGELSNRGHNISIANLNRVPDYLNSYKQKIQDCIYVYEFDKTQRTVKAEISFLVNIAKTKKFDAIVGFTEYPNMYAKIVGTIMGIPSIMSERGDPKYAYSGKGFKNRLAFKIINSSRGGVFQTDGAKEFYGKKLQKHGIVIANPIFIKGEIPNVKQSEREKTVVSVGRLDNYQKRYDIMLDAFEIFNKKHPEYTLKLYGDGGSVETIKGWVSEKGLDDKVKFMGVTKQPMQDIAKDGMFLITSDFEGISNSLLEAMAAGLPCVSTDHTPGGARLLITDHENGLLAPVADAQKLAEAMCEFAEDQALAEKCGNNAKDVVNRFAPEKIIDMWEDYILKITNK